MYLLMHCSSILFTYSVNKAFVFADSDALRQAYCFITHTNSVYSRPVSITDNISYIYKAPCLLTHVLHQIGQDAVERMKHSLVLRSEVSPVV